MTIGSQMPELDRGGGLFCPPPYKIGCQNTPYKLGLKNHQTKINNDQNDLSSMPKMTYCSLLTGNTRYTRLSLVDEILKFKKSSQGGGGGGGGLKSK